MCGCCGGVAGHLTTEREDGEEGWEGRVVTSTGDDHSLLPTALVAWEGEGRRGKEEGRGER